MARDAEEINLKVVLYGPHLSGKTSTVRKILETVGAQPPPGEQSTPRKGGKKARSADGDGPTPTGIYLQHPERLDFVALSFGRIHNHPVNFHLFGVPGQPEDKAMRILSLKRASGLVFVADSQPERMDANRAALAELEALLYELGMNHQPPPRVMQWNKRDLPSPLPVAELRAALNPRGVPEFETEALTGRGVMDTLKGIARRVIDDLRAQGAFPRR